MKEMIETIFSAPLASILVVAGIVFLFVAVLGAVAGKIDPGKEGRIAAGAIGGVLLVIGLGMHLVVSERANGGATAQPPAVEKPRGQAEEAARRQAEEVARRQAEEAARRQAQANPCDPIIVPQGATCRDFYHERSSWDRDKIGRCGLYQVSRYREALNIRSDSQWRAFLSRCK